MKRLYLGSVSIEARRADKYLETIVFNKLNSYFSNSLRRMKIPSKVVRI
jgi:hypothetical protein